MARTSARQRIEGFLDRVYGHRGKASRPRGLKSRLWLSFPGLKPASPVSFIHQRYYVNQQPAGWPSPNECVTAATIQNMNMIQDLLAAAFGFPAPPHADLTSFAAAFDARGPVAWFTRPPAGVPVIGGMLLPQLARRVLRDHARSLRVACGRGYRLEMTSGNTPKALIANLRKGYPTALHISQRVRLFKEDGRFGDYRALIGGAPHTVSLAGYDPKLDTWLILDPSPFANKDYTRWSTSQLMDLWGRKFLFYPPFLSTRSAFAMTTLIPDSP